MRNYKQVIGIFSKVLKKLFANLKHRIISDSTISIIHLKYEIVHLVRKTLRILHIINIVCWVKN